MLRTDDTNKCFISEKGKYQSTDSTELQQMDRQKLTVGSKIGFSVENKSHEAYYVYLLNITARDGAFVAFPSKRESLEYALIKGKETRILEGVFNFRTPGHEILKIILSLKPLDPRAFEFEGTEERKREITKGPQSPWNDY
ncbi:MAG: DUF4384 domain-containing protein [Nitrosomonas sp.]|nr:DUF4384 domain-containing protein [Nitrosomonas sp.]